MKLLICTQTVDKNDPILGFFHGWVLEFAKHFSEVHVICLKKGVSVLPNNVFVYSLGKEEGENRFKYIYRFYKYFWKIFFTVKVDFVFFHMGEIYNILAAPFYLMRGFINTKFYWWKTHGHINFKARFALNFVDAVFTAVDASFPVKTSKRKVVGHAIDINLFKPSNYSKNNLGLIFVGRIMPSKRVEQVIDITSKLILSSIPVSLKIIGSAPDETYFQQLKRRVVEKNIDSQVSFIGSLKHDSLPYEYQTNNIFINPSDNDGLDKVVLEAMACGAIPITANLSFASMLTPYNLYMQKGDIDGYVSRIQELLKMSNDERNLLSESLREIVIKNHSLATITERIFNI